MKKSTLRKSMTATALICTLATVTFTVSPKKKNNDFKNLFSRVTLGINKVHAAGGTTNQQVYDMVKAEVNTELKILINEVNTLLAAAKITTCATIPAASATALHTANGKSLYSSAVQGGKVFPYVVGSAAPTFEHKLELKRSSDDLALGALYVDCDSSAVEIRYMGKLDDSDTNIVIAYSESDDDHQTILMATDYDADDDYEAGKVAIFYTETSVKQDIVYASSDVNTDGISGTLVANTKGEVTGFTSADVIAGDLVASLRTLLGGGAPNNAAVWSKAGIHTMNITL